MSVEAAGCPMVSRVGRLWRMRREYLRRNFGPGQSLDPSSWRAVPPVKVWFTMGPYPSTVGDAL